VNRKVEARHTPLGITLLVYFAFVAVVLTFMPFKCKALDTVPDIWRIQLQDILNSIFLFFPLGFLCKLLRRRDRGPSCLPELVYGLLFSLAIYISQMCLVGRFNQVSEVLCNGLGAFLGARHTT